MQPPEKNSKMSHSHKKDQFYTVVCGNPILITLPSDKTVQTGLDKLMCFAWFQISDFCYILPGNNLSDLIVFYCSSSKVYF